MQCLKLPNKIFITKKNAVNITLVKLEELQNMNMNFYKFANCNQHNTDSLFCGRSKSWSLLLTWGLDVGVKQCKPKDSTGTYILKKIRKQLHDRHEGDGL
jgi:hypothetical protein